MEKSKFIGIVGIFITLFFVGGWLTIFIINPQTLEELNNVSLASYNLVGMNGRAWVVSVNYITIGLLNTLFGILLLRNTAKSIIKVGGILLLLAGFTWLTFGIFPYDPITNFGINILLIRLVLFILSSSIALILLGSEFKNKAIKWFTFLSGFLIILLSFLSLFIFNDITWLRTNLSMAIYFIWFGIYGLLNLLSPVSSPVSNYHI